MARDCKVGRNVVEIFMPGCERVHKELANIRQSSGKQTSDHMCFWIHQHLQTIRHYRTCSSPFFTLSCVYNKHRDIQRSQQRGTYLIITIIQSWDWHFDKMDLSETKKIYNWVPHKLQLHFSHILFQMDAFNLYMQVQQQKVFWFRGFTAKFKMKKKTFSYSKIKLQEQLQNENISKQLENTSSTCVSAQVKLGHSWNLIIFYIFKMHVLYVNTNAKHFDTWSTWLFHRSIWAICIPGVLFWY